MNFKFNINPSISLVRESMKFYQFEYLVSTFALFPTQGIGKVKKKVEKLNLQKHNPPPTLT